MAEHYRVFLLLIILALLSFAGSFAANSFKCTVIGDQLNRDTSYSMVIGDCLVTNDKGQRVPYSKLRGE